MSPLIKSAFTLCGAEPECWYAGLGPHHQRLKQDVEERL
ncbi:hypothetical protein GO616_07565 [Aeromonas hydrophila]|nr:hypothetical protein [Aeromonas hydrophila]MBW3770782.1 hypothetical protein [Aeromonas hydrophila]HAU4892525.1 hypothetical protein [Aeromonas hydrophila]HAU4973521.1 hypothetical protein [Aeromonas hydrophila]HAU4982636.1 hypothetical protein [Aeromonas hydrophila]